MNASRILRDRLASADSALDGSGGGLLDCAASMLLITTTVTTYPTTAALFYACNPVILNGVEQEGGTATPVPDTTTVVYALNLGTMVPPDGTAVLAHGVGGRWAFRYDG